MKTPARVTLCVSANLRRDLSAGPKIWTHLDSRGEARGGLT